MANVSDREWGLLAGLPVQEREEQMQRRFQAIAALPEEERRMQLRAIAEAEYALPDEKLRALTISRLRVWLQMEPEQARTGSQYLRCGGKFHAHECCLATRGFGSDASEGF